MADLATSGLIHSSLPDGGAEVKPQGGQYPPAPYASLTLLPLTMIFLALRPRGTLATATMKE